MIIFSNFRSLDYMLVETTKTLGISGVDYPNDVWEKSCDKKIL